MSKSFNAFEMAQKQFDNVADILDLPMWEGDKYFLPLVFDDDPRVFNGYMPYDNGRPLNWHYTRL